MRGICPYLGLPDDPQSCMLYADKVQRCFVTNPKGQPIDPNHQRKFCLSGDYQSCNHFVEPPDALATQGSLAIPSNGCEQHCDTRSNGKYLSLRRITSWIVFGILSAGLIVICYVIIFISPPFPFLPLETQEINSELKATIIPTSRPRPTHPELPTATLFVSPEPTATPIASPFALPPTAKPTVLSAVTNFVLSPQVQTVGWVVSNEDKGNHLGDSNIYSGVFDGRIFYGVMQFDLSAIPSDTSVESTSLKLTGLNDNRLAQSPEQAGTWTVAILFDEIDNSLSRATYKDIRDAIVAQTLPKALTHSDLKARQTNDFQFNQGQLALLQKRIAGGKKISLRLDGPSEGDNSLFSWDSGYGPLTKRLGPVLSISISNSPYH